jgi:small membrane protein
VMIKPIQIIAIVFALFALTKVILKLRKKKLTINEFIFWASIWTLLIILSIFPDISHNIASFFGFGRGLDFFIVSSILLILYLIFRIFVRLEELDSKIAKLTRSIALKELDIIKENLNDLESKKKKT